MIQDSRLHGSDRMQGIRLKGFAFAGNGFEQKWQQRSFLSFGDDGEGLLEVTRVGDAIVGRQPHANQQDTGAALARGLHHCQKIVRHLCDRKPAQTVVGTQGKNDDGGFELVHGRGETTATARGGFAADTGIDNAPVCRAASADFFQPLVEQRRPALLGRDAKAGREAVAINEYCFDPIRGCYK